MLKVENLVVRFKSRVGVVRAVDGVNFDVVSGERFVFVGESGSGKTVLAMALVRLLPNNATVTGRVIFDGVDLLKLSEKEMRKVRNCKIAYIPQNQASLNPLMKVGYQCAEPLVEQGLERGRIMRKVSELLEFFGIGHRFKDYPHKLSGGMRQRALLVMGLSREPEMIIADEPTKGLDAVKREQVVEAFQKLGRRTLMVITHDLPFAEKVADRIAVMYCGKIVEISPAREFFDCPLHPYSKGLLESLPERGMNPIKGFQPSLVNLPEGCRFRERCDLSTARCAEEPPLLEVDGSLVRCWLYADEMC
ncbi:MULTISPECIES: ABC transporter ATP-binding protein [unclassified Archaeoglobus]|jgi:peptide/nickel transport system ATP-binding protein|uniref:ABC transporter ATP-binding protein n=1 Tax=unclassified Archaeoglobus TaxID=2643606 RepID=UPI0025C03199|nr:MULTISPECIES: ABC transporter ATP-binding protein [unclassified Archaeoglobus]